MTEGSVARVGLVFVSHSTSLADGLVALSGQMAPSVSLRAAGGTDDGGIGTSFTKVTEAIDAADQGSGVVVLSDLGSALLIAETVWDQLSPELQARTAVVDAPIVEAGVAAAVAAERGGDLATVVAAAESARTAWEGMSSAPVASQPDPSASSGFAREVTLRNKDGLHARPAAEFVKLANTFGAKVTVNGKDAKSLLGIMSLGLTAGTSAEIATTDPGGVDAVNALADLVESGFGEA